jgi:hypothetical protein
VVRILQKLRLPVVSSLGLTSSLRAFVNNINFIGGAGSGACGMDPTKAPPLCCVKFEACILSLCSYNLYQFYRRIGIRSLWFGSYRASSLCALLNYISFIGGVGSRAWGMDSTKAPPPCCIKFWAGILSSCSCK